MKFRMYLCTAHKQQFIVKGGEARNIQLIWITAEPSPQLCEERDCREPINFLVEFQFN